MALDGTPSKKEEKKPNAFHNHQCSCLIETIFQTVDRVRLMAESTFMECNDVV